MQVLILGAGGMIGRKLTTRLLADRQIDGQPIDRLLLHDIAPVAPPNTTAVTVSTRQGNLSDPGEAERLIADRPAVIFHLAAVVSGEAEQNFDKGWDVNVRGSWALLEAIRAQGDDYRPRLVFTSSIAVFGAPFPEAIDDEFLSAPLTSYGTQKAVDELLLGDYSRKGFVDGIGLRLPTICVRPGKPNAAASSFFSSIIREPLAGQTAILPVSDSVRHWFASPRAAVGFLVHAAGLDTDLLGPRRNLTLPGLSCTVAEQIEALREVAGNDTVSRIEHRPDDAIIRIVEGWPRNFDARRAEALGFQAEKRFADIIRIYLDDDAP